MDNLEQLAENMNEQCLNKDSSWRIRWSADQLQRDYYDDSYHCDGYGRSAQLCEVCKSTLKQLSAYKSSSAMPEMIKSIQNELNEMRTEIKAVSSQLVMLTKLVTQLTKSS